MMAMEQNETKCIFMYLIAVEPLTRCAHVLTAFVLNEHMSSLLSKKF